MLKAGDDINLIYLNAKTVPVGWNLECSGREPGLWRYQGGQDEQGAEQWKLKKDLDHFVGLPRVAQGLLWGGIFPVLWADVAVGGEHGHRGHGIRKGRKWENGCLISQYSTEESPFS